MTSSSFPRFSRNLNTGEDVGTGTRMEVARQTILHTAATRRTSCCPSRRRDRLGGFPTYEAERRARGGARGGRSSRCRSPARRRPPLPDHVVEAVAAVLRRPMAAPPSRGLVGAARGARRRARAVDGPRRRPGDGDPRHERGHARARHLLPLPRPAGRRGRRAGSLLLLRGPDPGGRRDAGLRPRQRRRTGGAGIAEALERAIGPRTSALAPLQPREPDRPRPLARRRSPTPSRSRRGTASLVVTDEAYEAALWGGATLTSAFGLADDVVVVRSLGKSLSLPQLRLGIVSGHSALHRPRARARSSGTASASTSRRRRRRSPCSRARGTGSTPSTPASSPTGPPPSPPSPRRPGSRPPSPDAAPFLFVHADSGEPVAAGLARAGLPVVDGVHFQAPGYARLPFAGAAQAGGGARGGARPLGRRRAT